MRGVGDEIQGAVAIFWPGWVDQSWRRWMTNAALLGESYKINYLGREALYG